MKVHFNASARGDLARIYDYIHERNPQAASKVAFAIREATNRLSIFPHSGRNGGTPNTREVVVPRLPYIVVYTVSPEFVEIIAVFHAAEDRPRG